ncbi:hypothetical protein J3R82DRAFT_5308 [Butyriboletus roseoflavus]|nr:hypothetical protein J3R82DRAFT_5308 [Butyriboletus roseoflavus]
MPNASFLHVACFAVGAVVGGGVATVVSARKPNPTPPPAIIDLDQKGDAKISTALATVPTLSAVLKYGHPGPVPDLLVRKAYTAAYDRRLRHPAWTAEHLTLASLGKSAVASASDEGVGDRTRSTFTEDDSLPTVFRAKLQDYFKSGYDRGHMVPAADAKTSQEAMDETFLLSNIAPQVGVGFNRHYWAYVEDWCRRLTKSFSDVYVFTIPLYLPHKDPDGRWRVNYEVIGSPPNIAVPTHFAKVILASRPSSPSTPDIPEISTGAFVLPNAIIPDEAPLESFVMPVDTVERAAGLTLFSDGLKHASKHICKSTKCEVIVRRFDEAQKRPEMRRAVSAPR